MSNTQYAFLPRARIPSRRELQHSIDSLGFSLKLPPGLDLLHDLGVSPCILEGVPDDVGFQLGVEPSDRVAEEDQAFRFLKDIVPTRDTCLHLTWGSSMGDCASALIVSCALAKDFGAIVSYEGENPQPLQALLKGARQAIKLTKNQAKRGRSQITSAVDAHFEKHLRCPRGWPPPMWTGRLSPDGTKALLIASHSRGPTDDPKAVERMNRLVVYENSTKVAGALAVYDLCPKEDFLTPSIDNRGNVITFENDSSGVCWKWIPLEGQPIEGRVFDIRNAGSHAQADDRKTVIDLGVLVVKLVARREKDGRWLVDASIHSLCSNVWFISFPDFITTLPPFRSREQRAAYIEHLEEVRSLVRTVRRKAVFRDIVDYIERYVVEAEEILTKAWRPTGPRHRTMPRMRAYKRRLQQEWDAHVKAERLKDAQSKK